MGFYAVPYRVLFHDTMAYGSHHFLTNFKFQCIAREALFFRHIVDASSAGAKAHEELVLLTREGYARNLAPVEVGRRVGILISVEAQTPSSVRFCFRVIDENGTPVTCGYQTLVTVTAQSGKVITAPPALTSHFEAMGETGTDAFHAMIHAGKTRILFPEEVTRLGKRLALGELEEGFIGLEKPKISTVAKPKEHAWFFPGQGSFDAELLHWLSEHVPGATDYFRMAERFAQRDLGTSFLQLLESKGEPNGEALQLGIFLSAVLCAQWLEQQGQHPDLLVGHSAGELAALAIAGVVSVEDGLNLIIQRVLALRQGNPAPGSMLSLATDAETASALLESLAEHQLELAVRNHSKRLVYAGRHADITRLAQAAKQAGITAKQVASPFAFHTRLLQRCVAPFAKSLAKFSFQTPKVPLFSPLAGRFLSESEDWPTLLSGHFTQQLNFEAAVLCLRKQGLKQVTHCGVNHGMLGLLRQEGDHPQNFRAPFIAANRKRAMPTPSKMNHASLGKTNVAGLAEEPIAIVAMGCVLPGAHDVERYWQRLLSKQSALSHLDQDQPQLGHDFKKMGKPQTDKTYTLLGGYVRDYRPDFDQFPVAASQFESWAKGQQFLAGAINQCQRDLSAITPGRHAFYLGATADGLAEFDQALLLAKLAEDLPQNEVEQILANVETAWGCSRKDVKRFSPTQAYREVIRAVWKDDLPLWSVDAACASSMYAVIMGMQALRKGDIDMAICGGVFAPGPANSCLFSQFGGLSANDSRPLDNAADGVVFGEGAALVGLKRLSQAMHDGDEIHAVLRGYGMSSDGKSASVALPKSKGQFLAIERAYQRSGISKASIQVVEAHATATSVGDAVEYAALAQAFASEPHDQPRMLGSVKGLIGHTGWAAGTASLIKMVLGLRHQTVPPQPHFEKPNPKIDLEAGKFWVPTQPQPWPKNGSLPRRCALNGFGFGGTNAHLVLESFEANYHAALPVKAPPVPPEVVLVAWQSQFPGDSSSPHLQKHDFAPEELVLPAGLRVLPDALDDMDSCQKLATRCAHAALKTLGDIPQEVRDRGGVVFGLDGRCHRGEDVNQRLFGDALRHIFNGNPEATSTLEKVLASVKPSNAYTLPGMMPNVAAGRVANLLDFHGPNLVLSQPGASLGQAMTWAMDRLRDESCQLVVTGGVCQGQGTHSARASAPEYAAGKPLAEAGIALVFTTRQIATKQGWPILGRISANEQPASLPTATVGNRASYLAGAEGALELAHLLSQQKNFHLAWPEKGPELSIASERVLRQSQKQTRWPKLAKTVLVTQPCPAQAGAPAGHWLVLGASHQDTETLQWLTAHPKITHDLIALDSLPISSDLDAWQAAVMRQLQAGQVPQRLLVLANFSSVEDQNDWAMHQPRRLLDLTFLATQYHHAALKTGACQFAALMMGSTQPAAAYSGLFSGFAKSIAREFPKAPVKALLSDAQALTTRLDQLERVFQAENQVAVDWVFCRGVAKTWRAVEVQPQVNPADPVLSAKDLIVATGGGRGVTAVLVEALVKTYGCRAILLGRTDPTRLPEKVAQMDDATFEVYETEFYKERLAQTPKPHPANLRRAFAEYRKAREISANIARMQAKGSEVVYLAADLTQATPLEKVFEKIPASFGSPRLLIHGAGVQVSQSTARKRLADFHRTHATKLGGLAAVHQALKKRWPRAAPAVHLLTSAFSYFGNDGQPDYGAANEALNRLADSNTSPSRSWTSLAWLGWAGIGMTQGSEYAALMQSRNLHALSAAEGADIFLNVLADSRSQAAYYLLAEGEVEYYQPDWQALADTPAAGKKQFAEDRIFEFECAKNPVLMDHLVDDDATLPGALFIHLAREAAAAEHGEAVVMLSDLVFSRFAKVPAQRRFTLHAKQNKRTDSGDRVQIQLVSDFVHANGTVLQKNLKHFQTNAHFVPPENFPEPPALHLGQGIPIPDPYISSTSSVKLAGPYDCLRSIEIHETQQIALLAMPPAWAQALPWSPMVFVMDAMFRLAMIAVEPDSRLPLFVPSACDRVLFHQHSEPDLSQPLLLVAPKPVISGKLAQNSGVFALDATGKPFVSFWGMKATYRSHLSINSLPSFSEAGTF